MILQRLLVTRCGDHPTNEHTQGTALCDIHMEFFRSAQCKGIEKAAPAIPLDVTGPAIQLLGFSVSLCIGTVHFAPIHWSLAKFQISAS